MISIFNGRERTLGGGESQIFAKVGVGFREHLHHFKGARLAVFLAIALHADANGWAFPSYRLLGRETGYNKDTIARALSDLCELTIEGHRVLLRYQPIEEGGKFGSNRYLIFPSVEEVQRFEVSDLPYTENPDTVKPETVNPDTENSDTKKSHSQQKPDKAEPEREAEPAAAAAAGPSEAWCSIHDAPMELRQKDGDRWYSHRLADGTWCRGAQHDAPGNGRRMSEAERQRYTEWNQMVTWPTHS